jgi:hypothetical protein
MTPSTVKTTNMRLMINPLPDKINTAPHRRRFAAYSWIVTKPLPKDSMPFYSIGRGKGKLLEVSIDLCPGSRNRRVAVLVSENQMPENAGGTKGEILEEKGSPRRFIF